MGTAVIRVAVYSEPSWRNGRLPRLDYYLVKKVLPLW
jgi:hypothetical protein